MVNNFKTEYLSSRDPKSQIQNPTNNIFLITL